jgi:hypothetical protein
MAVDFGCLAVSFKTAKDCGPGDLQLLRAIHDRLVQGFPLIAVALAEMQAEQLSAVASLIDLL